MGEKILYGAEAYAQDRYAAVTPYGGASHYGERTTSSPEQSIFEALRGEGKSRGDEDQLIVSELALMRHFYGMSAAREKLSKVLNRAWQYDETVYPLYGILREQRDRETARAVGRAYMGAAVYGSEVSESVGTVASANGRPSATEWYAAVKQMAENQGKEKKDT